MTSPCVSSRGFTVVELLVVVTLLAILSGIAIPASAAVMRSSTTATAEARLMLLRRAAESVVYEARIDGDLDAVLSQDIRDRWSEDLVLSENPFTRSNSIRELGDRAAAIDRQALAAGGWALFVDVDDGVPTSIVFADCTLRSDRLADDGSGRMTANDL